MQILEPYLARIAGIFLFQTHPKRCFLLLWHAEIGNQWVCPNHILLSYVASGFRRCVVDHSVFYRQADSDCVILTVYVDDILLTGSNITGIQETKDYLQAHFVTKDMSRPKYFLDIEFAYTRVRMTLSQRKYALDLL